jgi:hypothetical protein
MFHSARYSRAILGSAQGRSVAAIAVTCGDIGSIQRLEDIGGDAVDGLDEAFGYAIPVRLQPVSSEGAVC